MKRYVTEKGLNNLIHGSIPLKAHASRECHALHKKGMENAVIMELDSEKDVDILGRCKDCKVCAPVTSPAGSGFFMTAGTILQARDGGKARYKRHSKKDCWALNAKGSGVVELKAGEHDDLLDPSGRVRECLVCSGSFRMKVAKHIKPSSPSHQHFETKTPKKEAKESQAFDFSTECIELILKLDAKGHSKEYIKGYIDRMLEEGSDVK